LNPQQRALIFYRLLFSLVEGFIEHQVCLWLRPVDRDEVVDWVRGWSKKTEISLGRFIPWLGIGASKFYNWRQRDGRVNEHNGWIPPDFWLEDWEKAAIIKFHGEHPPEGYRRMAFMMLDADVVAMSPAGVWRVLSSAGLLPRWTGKASRRGWASSSRCSRINTGISMFPTSTSPARFTTCAAYQTE
jgi:hypothetical protein